MELNAARRFATHLLEKNCEVDTFVVELADPKEMHAVRSALEELGCSVGIVSPLKHRLDVICPEGHLGKLIEKEQPDRKLL